VLSSCGRQKQDASTQTAAPQAPAAQPAAQPAQPSPEEELLRAAIVNPVYLQVGMQQPRYCEPTNARDMANISVQRANGHLSALIDRIPANVSQHDAVMALVKPTFASQSTGMISGGTCYTVDVALFQRYDQPGVGLWIPLGNIKAIYVQFINEYQTNTVSGPAQTRSYHVNYIVDGSASGGMDLSGVTGLPFGETCIMVHDNAENVWKVDSCQQPSNNP
jgi:hypothetical protein